MTHLGLDFVEVGGDLLWLFRPITLANKWQKMYFSSYFFSSGWMKNISVLFISRWALYTSVSLPRFPRSSGALSPFPKSIFCRYRGRLVPGWRPRWRVETWSYYITLPSLHYTPFQPLSLLILSYLVFWPFPHPWGHSFAFICVFISIVSFSESSLIFIRFSWICLSFSLPSSLSVCLSIFVSPAARPWIFNLLSQPLRWWPHRMI